MFPRDAHAWPWTLLCGRLKIASKRIKWNKTQRIAFRIIKTILDFLFINLVSNIILVKWKTFTKNIRHTYIISFFHSSLHAVAFREWNFVLFHRDGTLTDFTERIFSPTFHNSNLRSHHAHWENEKCDKTKLRISITYKCFLAYSRGFHYKRTEAWKWCGPPK